MERYRQLLDEAAGAQATGEPVAAADLARTGDTFAQSQSVGNRAEQRAAEDGQPAVPAGTTEEPRAVSARQDRTGWQ